MSSSEAYWGRYLYVYETVAYHGTLVFVCPLIWVLNEIVVVIGAFEYVLRIDPAFAT